MKYFTLNSILIVSIICSISCQKDKDPFIYENPYKDLTAEEYLTTYSTPEVMFQYVEVDRHSQKTAGILINNDGKILTYESLNSNHNLRSIEISIATLLNIVSNSKETGDKVNIEDLVSNYKKTRKVDINNLSTRSKESSIDTYFVAYDMTYDFEGNETCIAMGVSKDKYVQKLLISNAIKNNSIHARQIIEWMSQVLDKSSS